MRVSASSLRQIPTVECGFQPLPQKMSGVLLFGMTIEHFQTIRNSQIHISTSNMNKLRSVVPYYLISSKPKYPHEIIEARELSSGKIAIRAWVENMNNFLTYL